MEYFIKEKNVNKTMGKEEKSFKTFLKNNLISFSIFIMVVLSVVVIAGDVIVQDGQVTLEEDFIVNNSNLFIDVSTANVGIGTNTPNNELEVVGDLNISGIYYGDGSQLTGIGGGGNLSFNQTFTDLKYADILWSYNQSDGSFNATYNIWSYNQTGLGDTTIANETIRFANLVGTDCGAGNLVIGIDADGTVSCVADSGGGESSWVFATDLVTNDTNGVKFGLGTSSPTDTLEVDSTFGISGTNVPRINLRNGDANTNLDFDFPELTSANANIRLFRNTNTAGTVSFNIHPGDNSGDPVFLVEANTGEVGINTASPSNPLEIRRDTDGQAFAVARVNSNTDGFIISMNTNTPILMSNNANLELGINNPGGSGGETPILTIQTGGNAFFTGNLGVGDTSPFARMDVGVGGTAFNETIRIIGGDRAGVELLSDVSNTGGEPGGAYVLFSQDASLVQGIIGITQKAGQDPQGGNFNGTGGNSILIAQTKNNGGLGLGVAGKVFFSMQGDGDLQYNNTDFFIDVDLGRIGIGDTTPSYDLDVVGDIRATDDVFVNDDLDVDDFLTVDRIEVGGGAGSPTTGQFKLVVFPSLSDTMCWDGSGTSIIGDCSSTINVKTEVKDISFSALDLIKSLTIREFKWIRGKDGSLTTIDDVNKTIDTKFTVGLIAEEVDLISSDLVRRNESGTIRGLHERQIPPLNMRAIQELEIKLTTMEVETCAKDPSYSWCK